MAENQCPRGRFVANHIVRVYRMEKKRRSGVVGVVETVGNDVKKAFTNVDELWAILTAPCGADEGGPAAPKRSYEGGIFHAAKPRREETAAEPSGS